MHAEAALKRIKSAIGLAQKNSRTFVCLIAEDSFTPIKSSLQRTAFAMTFTKL